jgi:hypothetical protein
MAPWMSGGLWDHNYFANYVPAIAAMMDNLFVRGAVTGIGVVTALAGLIDLSGAIMRRGGPRPDES